MSRLEIFYELMESYYGLSRVLFKYQSTPREYSTNEKIYMMEMHLLSIIGKNECITISNLAKISERTKGAISQIISKLEKKGFVRKKVNQKHLREKNLFLTKKGKQAVDFHDELDLNNYKQVLERIPQFTTEDFKKMSELNQLLIEDISKRI